MPIPSHFVDLLSLESRNHRIMTGPNATTPLRRQEVSVLIVGGSLVGLTLSCLLAQHGITDFFTIEKHSSTAIHPRATVMMPRTMQVFKELGMYDTMLKESLKYYDEHTSIVTVESLAGKLIQEWMKDVNEGIGDVSATRRVFLTQQALEPLLRAKAKDLGATITFSTEMVAMDQDENGVNATLLDHATGESSHIRARYVIACDGFRSPIRTMLGISTYGPGFLSRALTIYFQIRESSKASLSRLQSAHYSGVVYVSNPTLRAFFRFDREKKESFLVINSAGPEGTEESRFPADTMTMERAEELLRAAIGDDSVEFDIHQLQTWEAIADVPERLRDGRVFLAGDAAHRMPPSGGFGGNTGVQDAHNLAWKLAMVLQNSASPDLLDTYEEERHPVVTCTVNNAFARYVHRTEPGLAHLLAKYNAHEDQDEHLELAYRYHSKALFSEPLDSVTESPHTAIAKPGSVAHHVLVKTADGLEMAISDLFGPWFLLIVDVNDCRWEPAVRDALSKMKSPLPLHVQRISLAPERAFAKRYNVDAEGAVLVRPDGFVAWSSHGSPTNSKTPEVMMEDVLQRILCLSPK